MNLIILWKIRKEWAAWSRREENAEEEEEEVATEFVLNVEDGGKKMYDVWEYGDVKDFGKMSGVAKLTKKMPA